MHKQSLKLMRGFRDKYAKKGQSVLDVGSKDINGSNRVLFKDFIYTGLDIEEGKNVNIVSKNLYDYPVKSRSFDIVISSQTLEHVQAIWDWVLELKRVVKTNGLICIIAPHTIREHRYPVDCWRIFPDGMRFLLGEHAGLEVLEAKRGDIDTIGIAQKSLSK